jgi:hypothetical protein
MLMGLQRAWQPGTSLAREVLLEADLLPQKTKAL